MRVSIAKVAVMVTLIASPAIASVAFAGQAPAKAPPYHVTVEVGQDGKVYHTTCRKLGHFPPDYIFSSCKPVTVIP